MASPRFGRYEQLFRIAAGGMAEVHAARMLGEAGFEKVVAVKRMLPHLADDPQFVTMFLDEARLAANVASPHVVSTLDLGRADDGSLYIVMELVVGVPLSALTSTARRDQRQLPCHVVADMMAQAASGLEDAHEARTPTGLRLDLVHRDVSPQNILVGADGRVRVMDFGVARALSRQTRSATGTLKGKFGYFSPEQARGEEIDRRSDVFALGIVAWEALVSRRLFEGETAHEQLRRVQSARIASPRELRPEVPEALSSAVMRALDRDVELRWQRAADFSRALRTAGGATTDAREIGALVDELAGPTVREMQRRIESAMGGGEAATAELDVGAPGPRTRTMDLPASPEEAATARPTDGERTVVTPHTAAIDTVILAPRSADLDAIATVAHRTRTYRSPEALARRSAWIVGGAAVLVTLLTLAALAATRAPAERIHDVTAPRAEAPPPPSTLEPAIEPASLVPLETTLAPTTLATSAPAPSPPPSATPPADRPPSVAEEPRPSAPSGARDARSRRRGSTQAARPPEALLGDEAFDRGL